jgi:uncharacterized membrane protein
VADPLQLVLGVLVLWAPGLAMTWALAPGLDRPKLLFVSFVVALTVQPGLMYLGNVFFGVPITATNTVLMALALAFLGLAWGLRPELAASEV